jgi:hypothetical protein
MRRRWLGLLVIAVVLTGCRAVYPEGSDAAVVNCLAAVRVFAPDAEVTEVLPGERGGWMVQGDTGHDAKRYPGDVQPWTCSTRRDGNLDGAPVLPS